MTPASGEREIQFRLQFDDNSLLPLLFGEHDRYLARIEQQLGVLMVSRGNRLAISGPTWAAEAARDVLEALYDKLKREITVDQGEVDAAIRLASGGLAGEGQGAAAQDVFTRDLVIPTRKRQISPRTPTQAAYVRAMREFELVFALGPAGTGKTYLAVATAISLLMTGEVDRIILSRPAVEAGERLGFLPGDAREKVDPYLRPLYDALYDMMPADQVVKRLGSGEIEVAPLAFMRGRTLGHSYMILDEAQNTTPVQMKMCLTRLGENSRMVVTGDPSQVDLPQGARSGLRDAIETLEGVEGITFVRFTDADMVRHPLVTRVVRAYEKFERRRSEKAAGEGEADDQSQ
ncbi:MAG: PhoH family protein [Alphaproteobacteria bacterium]